MTSRMPAYTRRTDACCMPGAAKFSQVGDDAANKLLEALFSGVNLGVTQEVVVVIDTTPGTGNFFQAF
jgi:hypothetical protein